MAARGVCGILMMFMSRIGWVFGITSGGVGRSFLVILDLRWVMTQKLNFGKASGVGIKPLSYSELLALRMLSSLIMWYFLITHQWNVIFIRAAHD
jgi:hypothetical protein